MGGAGPRLHAGPDRLARADPARTSATMRMYGLSAFFCGEQRVAAELGPIMRAVPDEDMRIFLCTQIADEARHVMFFDRFYSEVGVLEADTLAGRLDGDLRAPEPGVRRAVRRAAARARRPAGARARGHRDARRGDHDLPHGRRGDAGADRPALHHRLQREGRDAAGLRRRASRWSPATSTATSRSARASCATWCVATSAMRRAIQRALVAVAPAADGVLRPKWFEGSDEEATLLGVSVAETRAFALTALERRLKAIGLRGRRLDISAPALVAPSHRPTLREELAGMPARARGSRRSSCSPLLALGGRRSCCCAARPRTGRTSCARSRSRSTCATRTRCARSRRRAGEWLHLRAQGPRRRSSSRRSSCPAYEGDVGGVLPVVAARELEALKRALPEPRAGRGGQGAHQPGRGLLARLPRRAAGRASTAGSCCSRSPSPVRATA